MVQKSGVQQLIDSFSPLCRGLDIPGGAGFLPSTVSRQYMKLVGTSW